MNLCQQYVDATVDIAIWSTTEQGLAITAGSLATLRPLFRTIGSRLGTVATPTPSAPDASNRRSPAIFSDRSRDGQRGSGKGRSMIRLTEFTSDKDNSFKEGASRSGNHTSNGDWSTVRQGSEEELTSDTQHGYWEGDRVGKLDAVSQAGSRV